jgi:hypothetical protein
MSDHGQRITLCHDILGDAMAHEAEPDKADPELVRHIAPLRAV